MTWLGVAYLGLAAFGALMSVVFVAQSMLIRSDRYVLSILAATAAAFSAYDFGLAMCGEGAGAPLPPPVWAMVLLVTAIPVLCTLCPLTVWALLDVPLDRPRKALVIAMLVLSGARLADLALVLSTTRIYSFEQIQIGELGHLAKVQSLISLTVLSTWVYEGFRSGLSKRRHGWSVLFFGAAGIAVVAHDMLMVLGLASRPGTNGLLALPYLLFIQVFSTQRLLNALKTAGQPSGDLGGYEVIRKLGAGGMGEVFLARRRGPAGFLRDVVLKTLHAGTDDAGARERFLVEARLAAQLRHPNIVDVYDLGESPSGYFLVMEPIDGVNLSEAIRKAKARNFPPPPEVVAEIGAQMCRALSFAHAAGVIHRDIKPQNVMVSAGGVVKLIDFGVAQAHSQSRKESSTAPVLLSSPDLTMDGGVVGTLGYLSPERLEGNPASVASDLFAFGVLLYELTALQSAFPHEHPGRQLKAIIDGEYIPLATARPGLPDQLVFAVECCLAPRADDRPTCVAALQTVLEGMLIGHRVDLAAWVMQLDGPAATSAAVSAPPPPAKPPDETPTVAHAR